MKKIKNVKLIKNFRYLVYRNKFKKGKGNMKKSIKKAIIGLSVFVILFGYIPAFAAQEGWIKNADDSWSYKYNGNLIKNTWLQLNENKWYYFKEDGKMATGWIELNDGWYYLYSNGVMAYNTVIDGYKLNCSGNGLMIMEKY